MSCNSFDELTDSPSFRGGQPLPNQTKFSSSYELHDRLKRQNLLGRSVVVRKHREVLHASFDRTGERFCISRDVRGLGHVLVLQQRRDSGADLYVSLVETLALRAHVREQRACAQITDER